MRNIVCKLLPLLCCALFFSSCAAYKYQTLRVSAAPGTVISTPSGDMTWVVTENGKADVKLSRDAYYAYLWARPSGADVPVPFALDYTDRRYMELDVAEYVGGGFAIPGAFGCILGSVSFMAGDEDLGKASLIIGAPLCLAGAGIGASGSILKSRTQMKYHFEYHLAQAANTDLPVRQPVIDYVEEKPKPSDEQQTKPSEASSSSEAKTDRTAKAKSRNIKKSGAASKSRHSLKTPEELVCGTYSGKGSLSVGTRTVESYSGIRIIIRTSAKKMDGVVEVVVVESNGSEYFSEPSLYSVLANASGGFKLTHKEINSATIEITADGKLSYIHPKVDIDGDIYCLRISGTKQNK